MVAKTVLITGCTPGGIGHALALAFHSAGLRVFATARSLAKIEHLAKKGIDTLELDVTKPESILVARDEIRKRTGGKLDILVNNAGTWIESPALETETSDIKAMYDVNVFGPMEMVRQFIPLLFASKGTIVNIGSILGIVPYPMTAAYNGSKAALAQYSETLRLELEPLNISVVTVVTGRVATNLPVVPEFGEKSFYKSLETALQGRAKIHKEQSMSPEAYAAALVKQVTRSSPKPWYWKGSDSLVIWMVSTFAPKTAFDFLMKKASGLASAKSNILQSATSAWSTGA